MHIRGVSDHWLRNLVFELNQEGVVVSGSQLDPGQQLGPFHGNLRMFDCYGYQNYKGAVRIENLRGAQIQGCSSVGSAYFLWLKNCANVTVSGANVNWDGSQWARFGMRLDGCSLVTVSGCVIDGQSEAALHSLGSRLLTISNNVISNVRSGPGIRLEHSAQCTLQGNVISQSLGPAVHLRGTKGVVVAQNVIDGYGVGKGDATARSKYAILCDLPEMVRYDSRFLSVGFSLRRPVLMHLGWDALGDREAGKNRLLVSRKPGYSKKMGGVSGPSLRTFATDHPAHLWTGDVSIHAACWTRTWPDCKWKATASRIA